jgi:hypothetical protein
VVDRVGLRFRSSDAFGSRDAFGFSGVILGKPHRPNKAPSACTNKNGVRFFHVAFYYYYRYSNL